MTDALKIAVNAADDKKAHDLVALDISQIASFASYFLLCTGDFPGRCKRLQTKWRSD